MGMFDELRCHYPLTVPGANELLYQTKSFDADLDLYEIREDGTLWHQDYDVEDHSDPNAEGFMRFGGMMTRVRQRWEPVTLTGEVRFYSNLPPDSSDWIEWSASFVDGRLRELHLVSRDELSTSG